MRRPWPLLAGALLAGLVIGFMMGRLTQTQTQMATKTATFESDEPTPLEHPSARATTSTTAAHLLQDQHDDPHGRHRRRNRRRLDLAVPVDHDHDVRTKSRERDIRRICRTRCACYNNRHYGTPEGTGSVLERRGRGRGRRLEVTPANETRVGSIAGSGSGSAAGLAAGSVVKAFKATTSSSAMIEPAAVDEVEGASRTAESMTMSKSTVGMVESRVASTDRALSNLSNDGNDGSDGCGSGSMWLPDLRVELGPEPGPGPEQVRNVRDDGMGIDKGKGHQEGDGARERGPRGGVGGPPHAKRWRSRG